MRDDPIQSLSINENLKDNKKKNCSRHRLNKCNTDLTWYGGEIMRMNLQHMQTKLISSIR